MQEAKQSFEDQWGSAFEGAEMTPSEHVWTSIDGMLANQQASGFKKRILFFKWLAAASVSIAVLAISALWIQNSEETMKLAKNDNSMESSNTNVSEKIAQSESALATNSEASASSNSSQTQLSNNSPKTISSSASTNEINTLAINNIEPNKGLVLLTDDTESEDISNKETLTLNGFVESTSQTEFLSQLDAVQPNDLSIEKPYIETKLYGVANDYSLNDLIIEEDEFSLWAGVSMSAGTFNPDKSSGSEQQNISLGLDEGTNQSFAPLASVGAENLDPGSSLSIGVDLRGKISNKFVLSSGVHYMRNSASLQSSVVVSNVTSGDSFAIRTSDVSSLSLQNGLADGTLVAQNFTTNFNNELQYISIPFKAGYVILNKKVNIILNSGVSTNFLFDSQSRNSNEQLQSFSQENSLSNEFRPVYLNFLSSIEFGYTLGEKYFISLEPNYSQAITDFTKSESSLSGKANNFGLSVGIKYNF